MIIDIITSAFNQILLFSLIPFLVYLVQRKSYKGFLQNIGLTRPTKKSIQWALVLVSLIAIPFLILTTINEDFKSVLLHPDSVTGAISQMGLGSTSIVVILIMAVFKTSFSEEIFFRGFLAKRLIAITNFKVGNWIHAIIFGLIHGLFFLTITDNLLFICLIFIIPTISSYLKVIINEKMAGGSIIPGWIAHALANIISYSFIVFGG